MTPEAKIAALFKIPGGHIERYNDGRITVIYRSQRRDFPALCKTISEPDYAAAEAWVKAQDAPIVRDPVETEIATYFEEPA